MPEKSVRKRARQDAREGKSPSTQAGEFVHEEIKHIRKGKHGAKSAKQAIAIGLSKARRAGVQLPAPEKGTVPASTRRKATRDLARGNKGGPSRKRSLASSRALEKKGHAAASPRALSRHAKASAHKRGHADLSAAARKAARTRAKRAKP